MPTLFPDNIRRSLFWLLDYHPEKENGNSDSMIKAIEHCTLAESLGFSSVWCAEHHFQTLGTVPNPAIFLSAISQKTSTLRLGPAISVLPLHNPIQVAEDYAMVDLLSKGRLNMGVGTGSQPLESQGMAKVYDDRIEEFSCNLNELIRLWEFASEGKFGLESVNVAPVQNPFPPLYVTSNQTDMAYKIGSDGRSLITIVTPAVQSLEEIGKRVSAHKQGILDGGHDASHAESVVVVFTHVNESQKKAQKVAVPALGQLVSALSGNHISDATDMYNMMQSRGTGLFGSEELISDIIRRYVDLGVEHMAFLNRFGAMEWEDAKQSLVRLT